MLINHGASAALSSPAPVLHVLLPAAGALSPGVQLLLEAAPELLVPLALLSVTVLVLLPGGVDGGPQALRPSRQQLQLPLIARFLVASNENKSSLRLISTLLFYRR